MKGKISRSVAQVAILVSSIAPALAGQSRTTHAPPVIANAGHNLGDISITNPQHLTVPEERVQILHKIVREVAANYLRIREKGRAFPLALVLGDEREHFTVGAGDQADTIYLRKWDESKFVGSDVSLTVQHFVLGDPLSRMTEEISRRTDRIAPVNKNELGESAAVGSGIQPPITNNSCIAAITDSSVRGTRCDAPKREKE